MLGLATGPYKSFAFGLLGIALGAFTTGALQVVVAWKAPNQQAPQDNVAAPINVGTDAQTKAGPLTVSSYVSSQYISDSNNGAYYLNPDQTSRLNYGIYDNLYSYGWLQSSLFYDRDNNGYYIDPSGASNVNKIYSVSTVAGDAGTTLATKNYVDKARTWVDYTGSRANSTNYTNNTERDIEVSTRAYSFATGDWCSNLIYVNGVLVDYNFVNNSQGAAMCNSRATVPAGAIYHILAIPQLWSWTELR